MSIRLAATDRRLQILRVATGLFACKGYRGTTTREIADRARINEALLFRHFPSKEVLYWAIVEELCRVGGRRQRVAQILKMEGDDSAVFGAIAHEFLSRTPRDKELTRLLWFTALENHKLSRRFFRAFVADYYEALGRHIQTRIRQGGFRKVDPLLAARGFLGMVIYHFLVQELFGAEKYQRFQPDEVAATLTAIWLNGMRPQAASPGRNGSNGNHFFAAKQEAIKQISKKQVPVKNRKHEN